MPRKYYFIPETLAVLLILYLIEFLGAGKPDAFFGTSPHPYWIIVLLIASRYGTIQGLFAGVASAGLYYFLASGAVNFSNESFPHGPYKLPFFFILVGGIIGEIRNIHHKMHLKLEEKHNSTMNDFDVIALEHNALSNSKLELEKRIALQSTSMIRLFENITNLEQLESDELYEKIPELLNEQLNVKQCSIYLLKQNKLKLYIRNRANGKQSHDDASPDVVNVDEGIMGEVFKNKKLVTINDMFENPDFNDFHKYKVIMSAPILRRDETLLGVINIEQIPFFDYNVNSVRIFEMVAYWISVVVEQSMQFEQLQDKNIADEITGAYNYPYFQKRLKYEIARAQRFHSPLSLLLIEIRQFKEMSNREKQNVLNNLHRVFDSVLREIDIISKYKNEPTFAITLPGQTSIGTEKILSRLSQEIDNCELKPFEGKEETLQYRIGMSTLQMSEGSYETLVASAEERLKSEGALVVKDVYDDIDFILNVQKTGEDDEGAVV